MDEPFEIYILEGSLEELEKLSKGDSKDSQAAKVGIELAKQKGLKTLRGSHDHVDDAIVDIADNDTFVATQDKELKERIQENQGKLIVMRQKKHLVKEG